MTSHVEASCTPPTPADIGHFACQLVDGAQGETFWNVPMSALLGPALALLQRGDQYRKYYIYCPAHPEMAGSAAVVNNGQYPPPMFTADRCLADWDAWTRQEGVACDDSCRAGLLVSPYLRRAWPIGTIPQWQPARAILPTLAGDWSTQTLQAGLLSRSRQSLLSGIPRPEPLDMMSFRTYDVFGTETHMPILSPYDGLPS
jgi:hypothetical protein